MSTEIVILLSLVIASLTTIIWKFIDTWGKRGSKYYEVKAILEAKEIKERFPKDDRQVIEECMGIFQQNNILREKLENVTRRKK